MSRTAVLLLILAGCDASSEATAPALEPRPAGIDRVEPSRLKRPDPVEPAPEPTPADFLLGQAEPPQKPEKALDPKDPKSLAEHCIYNTRTQKSYETRFEAVLTAPKGDPIKYNGKSVWVAPDILYIHYTRSGGDEQNIVRAGTVTGYGCHDFKPTPGKCGTCGAERTKQTLPNVWVYAALAEAWPTSDETGMPGAARGIQNPDEVLGVLSQHLQGAKFKSPGIVEIAFAGEDIEKIMKEQARRDAFDWKDSKAQIEIHVNPDNLLAKFTCDAALKSSNPEIQGTVRYTAKVEIVSYNTTDRLEFKDDKQKPIPLSDPIRKVIEELTKSREKK